jgi:hypothetical protein
LALTAFAVARPPNGANRPDRSKPFLRQLLIALAKLSTQKVRKTSPCLRFSPLNLNQCNFNEFIAYVSAAAKYKILTCRVLISHRTFY